MPAHQRFKADHLARGKVELWLEVQEELAVLHRLAHPVLELDLLRDARIDARRVEQIPLAGFLGPLERRLGIAKDGIGVRSVIGRNGNASLRRDQDFFASDVERRAKNIGALQSARDVFRAADVRIHEREHVPAQARDAADVTGGVAQALRHGLEQNIAQLAAERIVDGLEALEVRDDERELGARRSHRLQRLAQALVE